MANYLAIISIEVLDILGVSTAHDIFVEVPDTATVAQVATYFQDYAAVLDGITDGQPTDGHVTVKIKPTGVKTAPVASSEVEKTGLFNYAQAGSTYKAGIDVPAIADTVIVDGRIDLSNAGVQAWRDFVIATLTGIHAVSKFQNDLTALLDALITFRKHRRAENRRSFEIAP